MKVFTQYTIKLIITSILLSTNIVFSDIGSMIEQQNKYFIYSNILYNNDFTHYNKKGQNYQVNFRPFYQYSKQKKSNKFNEYDLTSYGASTSIDSTITDNTKAGITLSIGSTKKKHYIPDITSYTSESNGYSITTYIKSKTSSNFTIYSSLNHSNSDITTKALNKSLPNNYYQNSTENILGYDFQIKKHNISLTPLYGLRLMQIYIGDIKIDNTQFLKHNINDTKYDLLIGGSITYETTKNLHDIKLEAHTLISYNLSGNKYTKIIHSLTNLKLISYLSNDIITDIGGSFSTKSNNNEFILSLNTTLAEKYSEISISAGIRKLL